MQEVLSAAGDECSTGSSKPDCHSTPDDDFHSTSPFQHSHGAKHPSLREYSRRLCGRKYKGIHHLP